MQILRQALFEKLNTPIILFKVLRNKILCLTEFQLILLNIDETRKKIQMPYVGVNVRAIQMSKDYIAILQRTGNLEIRRLDNIKQILFMKKNVKIANSKYPKLKWWDDDLHLIYQNKHEQINLLNKTLTSQTPPFQFSRQQNLVQFQFCDLFQGLKSIFYVLNRSLRLCLEGFQLGLIEFENEEIKQVLRLCHPLQANEFKKQFLVILTESSSKTSTSKKTFLKVYNILSMRLIFSKELYRQKDHQIEILSDELCEYLLVKHYKGKSSNSGTIQSQNLMKVNGDYFYSTDENYFDDYQPFFLFDIEIGLKKDLKLFPSHSEKINGKLCNSIDTCYYENNQVFIASIVLQASYKDEIYKNVKQIQDLNSYSVYNKQSSHQPDIIIWKQIVQAKVNPKTFIDKIVKKISLKGSNRIQIQSSFSFDIGIEQEQIIQDLLASLNKINKFSSNNFNKAYQTIKKIISIEYCPMLLDVASIQKDQNRTIKQIMEKSNEDFTNTMSGFSSSQPHSPRSMKSSKSQKQQEKYILKDLSKDLSNTGPIKEKNDFNICYECEKIQDHENLQLVASIIEQSSSKSHQSLTKIQEQIYKIEKLCKYRMEKMERKSKTEIKTQKNVCRLIQNEFQASLVAIKSNILNSAKRFTELLIKNTNQIDQMENKKIEYIQRIEDKCWNLENQFKIHKESKDQILDYLYDIEFPQVGMQTYQPSSCSAPFNKSGLSNSATKSVNKTLSGVDFGTDQNEEFKLFTEFVLKNFV